MLSFGGRADVYFCPINYKTTASATIRGCGQKNRMKAAVMRLQEGTPHYVKWSNPVVTNKDEVLMRVGATAIKHVDRRKASSSYCSSEASRFGK